MYLSGGDTARLRRPRLILIVPRPGFSDEVPAIRTNLPQAPNSFIGRQREVAELLQLMGPARAQTPRLLTLCGPGGIGKTRLALHVLARAAGEFADGAWVVDLSDLTQPDLVVFRIASILGVSEEPSRPLLDTLADALGSRALLVALDNCEHLIDVCAQVCQRLLASSPGLRLIVTSREPLRVAAEHVWQVPPLSVPPLTLNSGDALEAYGSEAISLFADRAAASSPGFAVSLDNAGAVATLCRALDGMPLAIELAAARVRALSVEQIGARLADRFRLLTTGDRTAPARHRTLRATIDWSHDLLTEPERILLRRLSVFAGWSLEMAEQVCPDEALPGDDVFDVMAALVDKSLVAREREVLGQARYRLLDSIREYAAAHLDQAGETGAFERKLRDYTLRVAEQNLATGMGQVPASWSDRVNVFRRYDAEMGNVWRVLTRCLAADDAETGLRIGTAISPCWIVRGAFAEGAEWLDAFLDLSEPPTDPGPTGPLRLAGFRGPALVARAQLALPVDPAAADAPARAGLELCRSAAQDFWTAAALNLLAETALHTGSLPKAAERADEALAVARSSGDVWHQGYALGTQAALAAAQGRLREASELAHASIAAMRGIDHSWGVARGLLGLADLARLRGDHREAHVRYQEALPILREIDSRPQIARCLAGLGRSALDVDELDEARHCFTESIRLSRSTGSRIGTVRALEAFAALAVREKEPERVVRLTAAASALRERASLPPLPGRRLDRFLGAARELGPVTVDQLWAQGLALDAGAAVTLALNAPPLAGAPQDVPLTSGVPAPAGAPEVSGAIALGPAHDPLTPREREVVALVARGYTNRAIADELVITPATAARHVANILSKLGFTTRTQVAWWLAGHPARDA
jgi:predicted ATPase/DNA-binding CsgD family transcriptional regulator